MCITRVVSKVDLQCADLTHTCSREHVETLRGVHSSPGGLRTEWERGKHDVANKPMKIFSERKPYTQNMLLYYILFIFRKTFTSRFWMLTHKRLLKYTSQTFPPSETSTVHILPCLRAYRLHSRPALHIDICPH